MHPPVQPWPDDSIEAKAYAAVADIPTLEMNDTNRLGYHVYLALTRQIPSLEEAVLVAQARMAITPQEAMERISAKLIELGVDVEA